MSPDVSRVDPRVTNLRRHAARGTLINSGFQIGLSSLGALQRVVVAAFLTTSEFGLWGIILTILINLSWLRNLGIADKFIQQSEPDQEAAFQKAFTLELLVSLGFLVLVVLVLPLWAIAYGHPEMILPGLLVTLAMPISAFESPAWIPFRRLQYGRQRLLTAVDPVVAFGVTIAFAVAGTGYWCFVVGTIAGSVAGALVCTVTSPYRLRLRFDRGTLNEYVSFSWPLMGAGLGRLLVVQGSLLVANHVVGLAGIGAIALATGFAILADRVDAIVSQTIYPAVCAVVERKELLAETFVKSNRLALMWAMPFGVVLALFASDLVHFVLGERWEPAIGLLVTFGLTCAFGQVAFNWTVFLRAVNDTRPILVGSLVYLITFIVVSVPAMFAFGLAGYAAGFAFATVIQVGVRSYYMRRLFGRFNPLRQFARAILPAMPGAALVLLLRIPLPEDHGLALALAELLLYSVTTVACTLLFERRLITELVSYVFGRSDRAPIPLPAPETAEA
jgi:O-antigen/teichoic acid export membrane protein